MSDFRSRSIDSTKRFVDFQERTDFENYRVGDRLNDTIQAKRPYIQDMVIRGFWLVCDSADSVDIQPLNTPTDDDKTRIQELENQVAGLRAIIEHKDKELARMNVYVPADMACSNAGCSGIPAVIGGECDDCLDGLTPTPTPAPEQPWSEYVQSDYECSNAGCSGSAVVLAGECDECLEMVKSAW